jgi:hypothetical protein
MSWDILIMDLPPGVRAVNDIPHDFRPRALGNRSDLIASVMSAAPMADFSDQSWGTIDGGGFSIEVNIGDAEVVESIMLHVRGGDGSIALIAEILHALKASAVDVQTGELFSIDTAPGSLGAWRAYRDRVVHTLTRGQ